MKLHFTAYLISIGYKSFRNIYKNESKNWEYIPCKNNIGDFSTCYSGKLDIRYIKDNYEIIYGLSEVDKSPTIIYPIPYGINNQNDMERFIQNNFNEEILKILIATIND